MTREEAITAVKEVTGMSLPWNDRHYEALQMAITALQADGDCISRQAMFDTVAEYEKQLREIYGDENELVETVKILKHRLVALPSVQPDLSEAYAKAVRNWLVKYQVKTAELKARYTPYEVLGWVVSDWRKDNEIW